MKRIASEDFSFGSMYYFPLSMEIVHVFQKKKKRKKEKVGI